LLNKTFKNKEITLKPENFEGTIKLVGETRLTIPRDSYATGSMFIYVNDKEITKRKTKLEIGVYEGKEKIRTITTSFLGPFGGN
jgi:hypothetical protein